jgi:hypothetical protein
MKKRNVSMWFGLFVLLMATSGCLTRPATTAKVHLAGFPDARAVVPQDAGPWSGTWRAFRSGGELFYLTITIDDDYCQYCTLLLEANGITKYRVKQLGRLSYYEGDEHNGYLPHPDRAEASFELEDKVRGKIKHFGFFYTLPESSRALGREPDFKKLGHDEKIDRCCETVTDDLRNIAQELAQKLKEKQSSTATTPGH